MTGTALVVVHAIGCDDDLCGCCGHAVEDRDGVPFIRAFAWEHPDPGEAEFARELVGRLLPDRIADLDLDASQVIPWTECPS